MSDDIQKYIDQLLTYHEVAIQEELWTPEFEQLFRAQLKQHSIEEFRCYRLEELPNRRLICRIFHTPTRAVVQEYPLRTKLKKFLPVLSLVFLYFLLTALSAKSQHKMLGVAFLLFLPFSFGAILQYVNNLNRPKPLMQSLMQQTYITLGIIILGGIVLREGVICLIMAAPVFWLSAAAGTWAMNVLCKRLWKPYKKVYSIALLPILALIFLPNLSQYYYGRTQHALVIDAPIQQVFAAINNIQDIQPDEIQYSPIFTMGFPKPQSGMTESTSEGLVRQIYWQRGIHFQEKIITSTPPYRLSWIYQFSPDSFPKGSLDDHLEMGGQYFNLLRTDYQLEAISPQQTRMILNIDYRLSTEINWYANVWTQYVLNEFSDVILNIYKHRLEKNKQI